MKVLIISYGYVDPNTHEQLEFLGEKCELDVLTLKNFNEEIYNHNLENKKIKNVNLNFCKMRYLRKDSSLFYFKNFLKFLKKKYDILHVSVEPWTLGGFQLCLLNKIFAKNKIVFITWENIFHKRRFPLNFFEWFVLRNSDGIVSANEEGKEILLKKGFKGKIAVFPILGMPSRFRKKKVKRDKKFTVGFVGRILKEKGLLNLIEAIKDLDVKLIILGRGIFKEELENRINELGIKNKVELIESVPPEEVVDYMNKMDVLVLPSLTIRKWKEQYGRVLPEAMACEVNVIGSSSAEIPNVIKDAGLIFKEGDSEDLKEKIKILMKNKELRKYLIRKGKERVKEFTAKTIAEKYYKIFEEVLI